MTIGTFGAVSVIVANNMIMETETAHVLQTCQMLAAFARIGCAVSYLWPDYGRTVPVLANLPIDLRPIRCRARLGRARYAEFSARLLPRLAPLAGKPGAVVVSRSLGVALAAQIVAPRIVLELHKELSATARLALPLLGRRIRWVGISGSLRDHLVEAYGVPADRVAACHDGVDYRRFAEAVPLDPADRPRPPGLAADAPVHLYYGTLRPERGLNLIAEAARALPGHGFVLIGGTATDAAAARANGLDRPNVLVMSAVAHAAIPPLLRSYDSVLLPYTRAVATYRWMSPLKLFEVLASGTPAVVSRLGPVTEVVGAEHAAFIDLDTPGSLATELARLAADPAAARTRAALAQGLVRDRYTWDQRAREIVALGSKPN